MLTQSGVQEPMISVCHLPSDLCTRFRLCIDCEASGQISAHDASVSERAARSVVCFNFEIGFFSLLYTI